MKHEVLSDSLNTVDLDANVSESGLELFFDIVSHLLAVNTVLEVEGGNSSVGSVRLNKVSTDVNLNSASGAVVGYSEANPFASHVAVEGLATSVPSEGTTLVVKHG